MCADVSLVEPEKRTWWLEIEHRVATNCEARSGIFDGLASSPAMFASVWA